MREVLALAVAGLVIGLITAWSTQSAIKSFLFGVKPGDPFTVFWAGGILFADVAINTYWATTSDFSLFKGGDF